MAILIKLLKETTCWFPVSSEGSQWLTLWIMTREPPSVETGSQRPDKLSQQTFRALCYLCSDGIQRPRAKTGQLDTMKGKTEHFFLKTCMFNIIYSTVPGYHFALESDKFQDNIFIDYNFTSRSTVLLLVAWPYGYWSSPRGLQYLKSTAIVRQYAGYQVERSGWIASEGIQCAP